MVPSFLCFPFAFAACCRSFVPLCSLRFAPFAPLRPSCPFPVLSLFALFGSFSLAPAVLSARRLCYPFFVLFSCLFVLLFVSPSLSAP